MAQKHAILETLHRVAWGYDAARLDVVERCFAPDAVMSMRVQQGELIGPYEGREAIMTLMSDSLASQDDQRRHIVTNPFFDGVTTTSATVTTYLLLVAVTGGTLHLLSTGYYRDEMILGGDAWSIRNRYLALDLPY